MRVSVVLCTWNRARLLDQTLAQLELVRVPQNVQWEILVVNNNCTDATDAVVAGHAPALPLRLLYEAMPGKSHAANLAIREATGDLLLWTDDDVLVDCEWLAAYVAAAEAHPEASFFGGPILPWFEREPPAWVERHMERLSTCYAMRMPDGLSAITPPYLPYGANLATRRRCFDKVLFNVRLGPREKSEIRGEETELLTRLIGQGATGLWVKGARVRHFIPAERLTTRFIWDFYRGFGRTEVLRGHIPPAPCLFGRPRWVMRQYVEHLVWSFALWPVKNGRWIRNFTRAATCRGIMDEAKLVGA
jgi:glycosyltransferase involved in cell wall biosynthesis